MCKCTFQAYICFSGIRHLKNYLFASAEDESAQALTSAGRLGEAALAVAPGGPPDEANKASPSHPRQVDLALLDLPSRFQDGLAQAGGKIKETSFNKIRLSTDSDSERPIVKRHLLKDARRTAQNRKMRVKSARTRISNKGAFE
jgi:hypothetical protein